MSPAVWLASTQGRSRARRRGRMSRAARTASSAALSARTPGFIANSLAVGATSAGPTAARWARQIGIDGPTTASNLPPFPPIITTCDDAVCGAFLGASMLPEPTTTPGTPTTDVPDDVLAPPVILALLTSLGPDHTDHTDHLIGAAILLGALTPPPEADAEGPGGPSADLWQGRSRCQGSRGANGGQPFAPPMVVRPIAGPGGERFSSIPPLRETRFFTDQVLLQVPANVSPDEVARVARELASTSSARRTCHQLDALRSSSGLVTAAPFATSFARWRLIASLRLRSRTISST